MIKKIIIACTLVCMIVMVSSVSLAKTIDRGQRGHHVSKVQTMLKHQGFLHDSIDGIYGHNTEQAVRKFQKSKGLPVDGRVGPATMNALERWRLVMVAMAQNAIIMECLINTLKF